ncbi:MAG: leucine--tRNA ligase [Leptospirales bacterium]|nr:leucine--tRNA ligase [Leptospirales bacterium]
MSYPFAGIESKWQEFWEKEQTFATPKDRTRPKFYVLDMFPYPSGAGLHVGHPEGYTATDIVARFKRMRGFNVLHPMGWDAFGLPAERYAMKTKIHPSITTEQNVNNFRRQLQALGFSYDWKREVNTTDPGYYKWTQWIFLKLFNSYYDQAERKAKPIKELGIPAELKGKTKAAERETYINSHRLAYVAEMPVNWCAELGTVLANEEVEEWTSKGYSVERKPMRQWMLRITAYAERLLDDLKHVEWPTGTLELQKNWIGKSIGAMVRFPVKGQQQPIEVFTTRPDTLFGVSYMVLSPEHPLVSTVTISKQKAEVDAYREAARKKSDLERQLKGEKEEKTGVFTGGFAIHPFSKEEIPIWIADYVLMGYGTGAIMAVPAHDERDFAFAVKFNLPIKEVVRPKTGESGPLKEAYSNPGINVNSDFLDGMETAQSIQTMIQKLEEAGIGQGKVNYRLRDWLFSRQRYWGEPIPVSFTEDGSYVAATEKDLPLLLPESDDFQPAASGESPLANLTKWVHHKDEKHGKLRRETNTMPQWAGSSWYYLRYIDPTNKKRLTSEEEEKYWMGSNGVDLYIGGAEHAVLHLLYARFWHKVLFDLGYVNSVEPFHKLVHQGLILGEDGQKMSKSLGNVVNPDDVLKEFGADSFRLYEMFLGPLEMSKPWSTKAIGGVFRFLSRVWRLYTAPDANNEADATQEAKIDPQLLAEPAGDRKPAVERLLHQTIRKVTEDIERLSFNTAISTLMVFVNETTAEKQIGKEAANAFLVLLSPFAPHIAEELWQKLGNKKSIAHETWPAFDPKKAAASEIEIVFQVNGKVKGKAMLAPDSTDDQLKAAALADDSIKRAIDGKEIRKTIVVKNKLVNLVV